MKQVHTAVTVTDARLSRLAVGVISHIDYTKNFSGVYHYVPDCLCLTSSVDASVRSLQPAAQT
jgi:hypothetical protein